ncbi:MAG: hypothetical protein HC817_05985 [Saprospiraceae bacterium]|nr:hypothetical protein [Saprospiraceae bacterium]
MTRKFLGTDRVDTYNIYDNYGSLVAVIPPDAITGNTVKNNLIFAYKYDNQNRLASKKVPGAGWQTFFYDARDLLVMTQDGNMRLANKYLATLYDALSTAIKF